MVRLRLHIVATRERCALMVLAAAQIVDGVVCLLTFATVDLNLYEKLLFSDRLDEFRW